MKPKEKSLFKVWPDGTTAPFTDPHPPHLPHVFKLAWAADAEEANYIINVQSKFDSFRKPEL